MFGPPCSLQEASKKSSLAPGCGSWVKAGEWVAIFGCGGVGLAAVNIAHALGANVVAVSRTPAKLNLAKEVNIPRQSRGL